MCTLWNVCCVLVINKKMPEATYLASKKPNPCRVKEGSINVQKENGFLRGRKKIRKMLLKSERQYLPVLFMIAYEI